MRGHPYVADRQTDLDKFAAVVLTQTPADQPWTPVTDYSFEARKVIEGRQPQLILETFHPMRLLDFGCGPAHLLRLLSEAEPPWEHTFLGYEPADGPLRYGVYQTMPDIIEAFDLVICREVLEHLTIVQLHTVVGDLCSLSSRFVYVTTRFHPNPTSLLDVATADDLDPTHMTMLNQDFLRVLFVLEGFKRRADLEEKMDWQQKGRVLVYERA